MYIYIQCVVYIYTYIVSVMGWPHGAARTAVDIYYIDIPVSKSSEFRKVHLS